jgi:hypothetical protein
LNYQKRENEGLAEQLYQIESNYEKLENENNQMLKIRDELIVNLDKVIKKIDYENNLRNSRNDLVNIFNLLVENSQMTNNSNNQSSTKASSSSNINRRSSIEENYYDDRNMSGEEFSNKNGKRASYITQNYEKFKQSQESFKKPANENKFINQSKIKNNCNKKIFFPLDYINTVNSTKGGNSSIQGSSQSLYKAQPQSLTPTRLKDYKNPLANQSGGVKNDSNNYQQVQSKQSLFPGNLNSSNAMLNSNILSNNSASNPKLKSDTYINKFINAGNK